jgi:hypothetical protein
VSALSALQGRATPRLVARLVVLLVIAVVAVAISGFQARAAPSSGSGTSATAAASSPKTAFQCEKKYKTSANRTKCFNQLPGSSCAHPLEIRGSSFSRGDTKYLKASQKQKSFEDGDGATVHMTWGTKSKNVAICPYPRGAVLRLFHYVGGGVETGVETIPEHTSPRGGVLTYEASSEEFKDYILMVRGYLIHPPRY